MTLSGIPYGLPWASQAQSYQAPVYQAPVAQYSAIASNYAPLQLDAGSNQGWFGSVARFGGQALQSGASAFSGFGQAVGNAWGNFNPGFALPAIQWGFQMPQLQQPQAVYQPVPVQRTPWQNFSQGVGQAFRGIGTALVNNAPAAIAFTGATIGASATCVYMGGAMAATGAMMLGSQAMMQGAQGH